MKLQNYKDGEIHRVGDKYQYVVDGEVKSTHNSIDLLVKAQSKKAAKPTGEKSDNQESLE